MDCSPPVSSIHGILQARILESVVISFSRGSSWFSDQSQVSGIAGGLFTIWANREVPFSSVQLLSGVWLFPTLWTAAGQASLSITNSWSLVKLTSIKLVIPSDHLTLCHLLLPPSIFPSIRICSNESVLHSSWPKYWSFNFSISLPNEYAGLVGSPCSSRNSQESSPTPQFKSINFLMLSFPL